MDIEELPPKIYICKCDQCKARKQSLKSKTRKFFKRMTSKKRRKNKSESLYYA